MSAQRSFREFVSQRFSKLQTELLDEHEAKLEELLVENKRLNTALGEQSVGLTASALSTAASTCAEEVPNGRPKPVDSDSLLQRSSANNSPSSANSGKLSAELPSSAMRKLSELSNSSGAAGKELAKARTFHEAPPPLELPQTIHEVQQPNNRLMESLPGDMSTEIGISHKRSSDFSQASLLSMQSAMEKLEHLSKPGGSFRPAAGSPAAGCRHSISSMLKTDCSVLQRDLTPKPSNSLIKAGMGKMSRSLRFSFQPQVDRVKGSVTSSNADSSSSSPKQSKVKSALLRSKQNSQDILEGAEMQFDPQGSQESAVNFGNCNYRLHEAWRQFVKESDHNVLRRTLSRARTNVMDIYKEAEAEEDTAGHKLKKTCFTRRVAVLPTSKRRLLWDLISFVFVCYDAVVIPLQFFDPPDTSVTMVFAHSARIFWTIDIIWSFITIQMSVDGDMEVEFLKIAYHYMTTWFVFDIFIVVVDWIDMVSSVGESSSNSSSAIRSMRVFRAIRLLRLMRLVRNSPEISRLLATYIRSEKTKVVFGVGQITVIVIGIAHVIACCWYGVSINTDGDSWVKMQDLENASLQARYVSSFYWSMVQFTGSGIMAPQNNSERVFGCFVLMIAFMISVSIVSSLTTLMTRLQLITAQTTRQLSVLHRYLIDHKISSKLASRVQRNASHALAELRKNTPESGVELLELVSKPLRVELRFEVNGPVLMQHPFFSCYSITNPGGIRQVCFMAVSDLTLSAGDIVFNKGEKLDDTSMLFVLKGKLKYTNGEENVLEDSERILEHGNWICEAVLWVEDWALQGALRAKSECKLLCLHAARFQATSAAFRTSEFYAAQYGIGFLQDLNLVKKVQLTDIAEDIINISGVVRSVFPEEIGAKLKSGRRHSSGLKSIGSIGTTISNLTGMSDRASSKKSRKTRKSSMRVGPQDSTEFASRSTSSTDFSSVCFPSETCFDKQISNEQAEQPGKQVQP